MAFTTSSGRTQSALADININDIGNRLRQKIRDPRHQSIFVRADENVPFGAFATVMDAVKQAGFVNVSIVTQPMDTNAKH